MSMCDLESSSTLNIVLHRARPARDAQRSVSTLAGNTTAAVQWSPPTADGTPTVDGYAVNAYYPDGSYTRIQALACAGCTSVVVPGLTNGRAYYFAVFAPTAAAAGRAPSPVS